MIFIIVWLFMAFIASGFLYANLQREYICIADEDRLGDSLIAIFLSIFGGPVTLLFGLAGFSILQTGWKLPFSKVTDEEWEKYASDWEKLYCKRS